MRKRAKTLRTPPGKTLKESESLAQAQREVDAALRKRYGGRRGKGRESLEQHIILTSLNAQRRIGKTTKLVKRLVEEGGENSEKILRIRKSATGLVLDKNQMDELRRVRTSKAARRVSAKRRAEEINKSLSDLDEQMLPDIEQARALAASSDVGPLPIRNPGILSPATILEEAASTSPNSEIGRAHV